MRSFLALVLSIFMAVCSWAHGPRKSFDFKENKGQWPEQVLFKAEIGTATLFLESNSLTYSLVHPEDLAVVHEMSTWTHEERSSYVFRGHAFKVHFDEALTPNVVGQERQSGYYNYFLGSDQSQWASQVGAFGAVRYSNLYNGIGLRVYNSSDQLKYDFLVSPGADASQIVQRYDGVISMELVEGELRMTTSVGDVIERAPYAYQMNGSEMVEVPCSFVLEGDRLSFAFPEGYDASKTLVIDPIVIASTLSGSTGSSNYGHSAAYDLEGNIYTGAIAFGSGYPTTTGAFQTTFGAGGFGIDIAVSKLNPTGTDLVWASYLGGSDSEYPHSLITNTLGELYVYGSTQSTNFPTTTGAFDTTHNGNSDIIVTHFSADGSSLVGSSYIGGTGADGQNTVGVNYGDTYRGEIFLDLDERPIVASFSASANFPTTGGAFQTTHGGQLDAVLFCMNPTLTSMNYSTYLGGSNNDTGFGVRVSTDGGIYMVGMTEDGGFPVTAGAYQTNFLGGGGGWNGGERDGYVARFNATATALEACTFFGTTEEDQVFFLDLDNNEDVWIYGQTQGDIPNTVDVYSEPNGTLFISKLNPGLTDLLVSSRVAPSGFGGYGGVPVAFLVDRCDNIYISTHSANSGLSLTDDAVYQSGGFYLAAYSENMGTLEFATYYTEGHVDGGTSRFDKSGIIYQGVCSGGGFATNPDAWAPTQFTGWDIGVFKMDFQVAGVNAALTASAEALNGCAPHTVDFNNYSVGNIFTWDFGDGSAESNEFEPSHTYTLPGLYTVRLISLDSLSCNLADTAYIDIAVSIPQDFTPLFDLILDCESMTVSTENQTQAPWLVYTWDMGDGTILEGEDVQHTYAEEGTYIVSVLAVDLGCDADEAAEQEIQVVSNVFASTDAPSYEGCGELTINFNNTSNGLTYTWDFGDGSPVSNESNPVHTFQGPGVYEVLLTAFHPESCNLEDQTSLTVSVGADQVIDANFQLIQTDCEELTVVGTNMSTGDNLAHLWNMGDGTTLEAMNIEHDYNALGIYEVQLTITDTLCNTSDTYSLNVNILNEVTAIIGNPNQEGCAPFNAQFVNNSAGSNFFWDFGDGSPVVDSQVATHTYAQGGTYTVTLTVEGSGNCGGTDVTTAEVTVVEPPIIDALFTAEQIGACEAMTVNFADASTGDNLDYDWNVNGVQYSVAAFEHIFLGAGNYIVTLTISEPVCDASDVYTQTIPVLEGIDMILDPEQYLCYYQLSTDVVAIGPADAQYEWSTGDEGLSTSVSEPGVYTLTGIRNNCTQTLGVTVSEVPKLNLFDNPTACEGVQALLQIPYDQGSNYVWCTGETVDYIYASQPGEYCYQFTDQFGCLQEGNVQLDHIARDASVYVPNAFTPNNDGVNDVFKAYGEDIREFKMIVFNRWGDEVFGTENPDDFWDGSYQGSDHYTQNEVYTYRVEFNSACSAEKVTKTGYVVVLR